MDPNAPRDPVAVAALVGAGTLVGHEVGYLADASAGTGHEYFSLIIPVAIVGVAVAVWSAAVSVMRRGAAKTPSVTVLAAAQTALYLGFEVGERTIGATDSPLLSLPVVLGLIAQPLVAWIAIASLELAAAIVATAIDTTPSAVSVEPPEAVSFSSSPPVGPLRGSAPARAPPLCF